MPASLYVCLAAPERVGAQSLQATFGGETPAVCTTPRHTLQYRLKQELRGWVDYNILPSTARLSSPDTHPDGDSLSERDSPRRGTISTSRANRSPRRTGGPGSVRAGRPWRRRRAEGSCSGRFSLRPHASSRRAPLLAPPQAQTRTNPRDPAVHPRLRNRPHATLPPLVDPDPDRSLPPGARHVLYNFLVPDSPQRSAHARLGFGLAEDSSIERHGCARGWARIGQTKEVE